MAVLVIDRNSGEYIIGDSENYVVLSEEDAVEVATHIMQLYGGDGTTVVDEDNDKIGIFEIRF